MSSCPHCDPYSFALAHLLKETKNFRIVCDAHPIIEGHILIVPKNHIACIGALPEDVFRQFEKLYLSFTGFVNKTYGKVSAFEHGIIGQTVSHAHMHILPYGGSPADIIPEGDALYRASSMNGLRKEYANAGKYLFFAIGSKSWLVDPSIGTPRFFRDRFARALGVPGRGDWKSMEGNSVLTSTVHEEITSLEAKWKKSGGNTN